MNGNRYYGVRVEGAKYGVGLGLGARHRDLLYQQPLDSLGDHPRHSGLALRDLCRPVRVIRLTASTPDEPTGRAFARPVGSSALRSLVRPAQAAFAAGSTGAVSIARM
jgi:hypothetical protein